MPVSIELLRDSLGLTAEQLPDDASDEQITSALEEHATSKTDASAKEKTEEKKETPEAKTEEKKDEKTTAAASDKKDESNPNAVYVDREIWERMKSGAEFAVKFAEDQKKKENQQVVAAAVTAGKIPPSRKDRYITLLNGPDREGTLEFLNSLEASTVPLYELGTSLGGEEREDEAYDKNLLTEDELERVAAARVKKSTSRIVVEH